MSYPQTLINRRKRPLPLTPPWNPDDEQTNELLRRATEAVINQPEQVLPVMRATQPVYTPGVDLQATYSGNISDGDTRPRVVGTPIRRMPEVSTSITPEMVDGSVPVTRPVQPVEVPRWDSSLRVEAPELETSATRPRLVDPIADLERRREYDRVAPPKVSRKKAILMGALRGLAQGGLGGAIGGATVGAISPDSVSRMQQQELLAEDDREIDQSIAREGRRAQIDWMRQRPAIAAARESRIGGQQASTALSREQGVFLRRMGLAGKYKRGENPTVDAEADRLFGAGAFGDFDKSKRQNPSWRSGDGYVWTTDETGKTVPVINPATNEQMRSEGAIAREATATARATENQYQDDRDRVNRDFENQNRVWEDANRAVGELRKAQQDLKEKNARAKNPPARQVYDSFKDSIVTVPASEEDRARYQKEAEDALQRVRTLGDEVQRNYGDFVESDEDGWPTRIKARPTRPDYPSRPAPVQPNITRSTRGTTNNDPLGIR